MTAPTDVEQVSAALRRAAGALNDLAAEHPDLELRRNAVGNLAVLTGGEQIGHVDWWEGLTLYAEQAAIDAAIAQHLRPGQRVNVTYIGKGTIAGKETRNLTEVISYTVKLDHPRRGENPYVEAAPDRVQAIP